jgi:hypothetical protein
VGYGILRIFNASMTGRLSFSRTVKFQGKKGDRIMVQMPTQEEQLREGFKRAANVIRIERAKDPGFAVACDKFPCHLLLATKVEGQAIPTWCARSRRPVNRESECSEQEERTGADIRGRRFSGRFVGPCDYYGREDNFKEEGWEMFAIKEDVL